MYVEAAQPFEAVYESSITGLVGTVAVSIVDNVGVTVTGPTTADITENIVGGNPTGVYTWVCAAAPALVGQYSIVWSYDGSFDPNTVSVEDLTVVSSAAGVLPPIPAPGYGGVQAGPCTAWTTSDDVVTCCGADVGSDTSVFDDFVIVASQILFELSGRLYAGLCEKTVRPCRVGCNCGIQVLSRGHVVGPWDWSGNSWGWNGWSWECEGTPCGCQSLSRVLLSGYPVREITEVKIDGDVVSSDTYRLDDHRYLTRVRDPADPDTPLSWPSCQALDLDDTQDGTFSVTYVYGQYPNALGVQAANALACELYTLCTTAAEGECTVPSNVTRITRQGVTIDTSSAISWFYGRRGTGTDPSWNTGLTAVDAFLNSINPYGMRQRPRTWSPDGRRFAKAVGS